MPKNPFKHLTKPGLGSLTRLPAPLAVGAAGVCAMASLGTGVAFAFDGGTASAARAVTGAKTEAAQQQSQGGQLHRAAEEQKAVANKNSERKEVKRKADQERADRKAQRTAADWTTPVDRPYTLSATFGNDGDRWAQGHSGQDFAVPTGTEVDAVHEGTVVTAGWGGSYGNRVVIEHGSGEYTQYAHLSKINVQVGQSVDTDQKIGLSGSTGNSSGPHLHFEVRSTPEYGSAVDPVAAMTKHGVKF